MCIVHTTTPMAYQSVRSPHLFGSFRISNTKPPRAQSLTPFVNDENKNTYGEYIIIAKIQ